MFTCRSERTPSPCPCFAIAASRACKTHKEGQRASIVRHLPKGRNAVDASRAPYSLPIRASETSVATLLDLLEPPGQCRAAGRDAELTAAPSRLLF